MREYNGKAGAGQRQAMGRVGLRRAAAWSLASLASLASLLMVAAPSPVRAGEGDGFNVDLYRPAPVLGRSILGVGTSELLEHGRLSLGAVFSYQDDPLTMVDAVDRDLVLARFIDHRVTADLFVAIGLFDYVELALSMPFVLTQGGDDLAALGRPGEEVAGFAKGDLAVVPKVKIIGGVEGFQLHLAAQVAIPIGDQAAFASDGAVRITPLLGLGYATGGFRVAAEVGYELREKRTAATYVGEDVVRWGLGLRVPLLALGESGRLGLLVSGQGTVQTAKGVDPDDPSQTLEDDPSVSVEALGAVELVVGGLAFVAGGGASLVRAVGSPDVRAFLAIGWTAGPSDDRDGDGIDDALDKCIDDEEDEDRFEDEDGCPDPDNDGDGVLDVRDRCPTVAGVAAESGCVSKVTDRDGDGLSDDVDRCPGEPEDTDRFQDQDGCPDLDNDGDGVPDATDKCALAPEDKDGFDDGDGCPDPDNDGDGVADGADKCPNLPEVFNGFEDADGCPDNTDKDLVLSAKAIELKRPVAFVAYSDTIKPESLGILDSLARLLVEHTYLTKVQIESHTDSEGTDEANLALTQKRAQTVVDYLVGKGVARGRLVPMGLGESRPLMPNDRPDRRAKNRRVEVLIL